MEPMRTDAVPKVVTTVWRVFAAFAKIVVMAVMLATMDNGSMLWNGEKSKGRDWGNWGMKFCHGGRRGGQGSSSSEQLHCYCSGAAQSRR